MVFLRSLAFNVVFWLWTALLLSLSLPLLLAPSGRIHDLGKVWAGVTFFWLKVLCGLDHEIRGLENLPRGAALIACKHQSAWETMIFALIVREPAFVFKRELLRIPLFGWFLGRAEMVPIDRSGGASTLKSMLLTARQRVAAGRPIIIYPEGTRTAPGERRPYLPGVYALYRDLKVPTIPMALNSGLYWRREAFRKYPGRIRVEILPPIEPGLSRAAFMEILGTRIEETTDRLVAEAGDPKG